MFSLSSVKFWRVLSISMIALAIFAIIQQHWTLVFKESKIISPGLCLLIIMGLNNILKKDNPADDNLNSADKIIGVSASIFGFLGLFKLALELKMFDLKVITWALAILAFAGMNMMLADLQGKPNKKSSEKDTEKRS